jgi:lactoylglutathione lyase
MPARRKSTSKRRKPAAKPGRKRAARPARAKTRARAASPRKPATRPGSTAHGIGLISPHLDYTTHDLEAVRRFYTDTLGFSSSMASGHEYLTIHLSKTSSIGFMPPEPGPPEQWRPPREPALYFLVADVDAAHAKLVAQGVSFGQPPSEMPWGHRATWLRDPEGRMVWIATARTP